MSEDDAHRPTVPTTDVVATVAYESSHGGQVEQRGSVIYQYGKQESDPRSMHILLDAERVLVASTTTGEVRAVAVEDALMEAVSETPGPDGYDVLAASLLSVANATTIRPRRESNPPTAETADHQVESEARDHLAAIPHRGRETA